MPSVSSCNNLLFICKSALRRLHSRKPYKSFCFHPVHHFSFHTIARIPAQSPPWAENSNLSTQVSIDPTMGFWITSTALPPHIDLPTSCSLPCGNSDTVRFHLFTACQLPTLLYFMAWAISRSTLPFYNLLLTSLALPYGNSGIVRFYLFTACQLPALFYLMA